MIPHIPVRDIDVEKMLQEFDFEGAHKIMTDLRWRWWNGQGPEGVPTLDQLRQEVRAQVLRLVGDKGALSSRTGGFKVSRRVSEMGHEVVLLEFIPIMSTTEE